MKTDAEYLVKALDFVENHDLGKHVNALLDYWEENPISSLGHGFGHVMEVAVEAYELAVINKYKNPKLLFLAGLFHDVYRPAKGEDGSEEHHWESLRQLEEILKPLNVEPEFLTNLKFAISDDWKVEKNPSEFAQILFVGDKAVLHSRMADAYAWASNTYCLKNNKPIAYPTPLHTMRGYVHYMNKVWDLIFNLNIVGKEKLIFNFVDIVNHCQRMYLYDPEGKNYQNYLETVADMYREKETKYLEAFGRSKESIKKIIHE
ncbi:HD domain-containing protein [Candidatus Dojkabacteria bacterium]|uniref:HD domain-containing protein n=1 Tax=Candidatus Dojkabacteria bacterium TaxID=2099670 RepID=A0A955I8Y8_9BACT|nr:HD domain-containing protein [Candidatus Dojkabacteria bacterium]